MKLSTCLAALYATASASKLQCDVSTLFAVDCSATSGMQVALASMGALTALSADCMELIGTGEFEMRTSGSGNVPNLDECLVGDIAVGASFDALAQTETTCWSKSDSDATYLKFMTDVFIFDKAAIDIRPWPKVSLTCDIAKAITVTPMSITVTEGNLDDVGSTANPTTLSMKALRDNTDVALTPSDNVALTVGETVFFFVETDLSSQLDLVLGSCSYMNDEVEARSDYVMGMSNMITTDHFFATDYAGFTMHIYQNSEDTDMVYCDVTVGFAQFDHGLID